MTGSRDVIDLNFANIDTTYKVAEHVSCERELVAANLTAGEFFLKNSSLATCLSAWRTSTGTLAVTWVGAFDSYLPWCLSVSKFKVVTVGFVFYVVCVFA